MKIFGSGMAACIVGLLNNDATLYEALPGTKKHNAVLRFRTNNIGIETGIPFEKVKVYKGIWHNDKSVPLSPRHINLYSRKVVDACEYRSICNLKTETRYIAPENFHEQMLEKLKKRIKYNADIKAEIDGSNIISTIPLPILLKILDIEISKSFDFETKNIYVSKYKIPDCNVYMTYYFTDPTVLPYRASITKDILIVESIWKIRKEDIRTIKRAFGLTGLNIDCIVDNYQQSIGKIRKTVDDKLRRQVLFNLTAKYNIYSLGRYATWRNILLDDVLLDIDKINRLIQSDIYEMAKGEII